MSDSMLLDAIIYLGAAVVCVPIAKALKLGFLREVAEHHHRANLLICILHRCERQRRHPKP